MKNMADMNRDELLGYLRECVDDGAHISAGRAIDELERRLTVMTAKYEHAADTVRESCQVYERICREYRETIEAMNAKIRDAHSRPGFDCPCGYCREVRHG
jgi:hypothetical protein